MSKQQEYTLCRMAIWVFFFLLIFEGAFRKWLLPSLSDLFLVIRDPLAIYVVWVACKFGLWRNHFVKVSWLIALVTFVTSLLFGHQNLLIALYGVRVWVYYIPFIFAVPLFLSIQSVWKMCKCTLYITIGMAVLLCLQYFTPQTSVFNIGVGGTGSSGFGGVGEYFRPSGTFSFTAGLSPYMVWAGCCLLAYLLSKRSERDENYVNPYVLWLSLACFLVCVPVSLSRGVVASVAIVFAWALGVALWSRRYKRLIVRLCLALCVIVPVLLAMPRVQIAIKNMEIRFAEAEKAEGDFVKGSMVQRGIVAVFEEWLDSEDVPLLYGEGIGISTNVAATLLAGEKGFLTREGGSDLIENGYLMGSVMFFYKWVLLFYIVFRCLKARRHSLLPLLFAVAVLLVRPGVGQVPTLVGFNCFIAAVTLTLAVRSREAEYSNLTRRTIR